MRCLLFLGHLPRHLPESGRKLGATYSFPAEGVWRSTLHLQAGTRRYRGETESTFGMTYHSHWRAYEEALLRAERVMG